MSCRVASDRGMSGLLTGGSASVTGKIVDRKRSLNGQNEWHLRSSLSQEGGVRYGRENCLRRETVSGMS